MTDTDLLIQNLRRENEALRAELEWKQKEIELARSSSGADRYGGVLMKAFIQLTNNRSCLLRADEIKADYVYMTEPRKENDNGH